MQSKAILLRKRAGLTKKKKDQNLRYILLNASITINVAAWDSYLNNIIREFINKTSDPADNNFSNIHALLENNVGILLKKFNTPNSENARNILLRCTGYDPLPDWTWPQKGLSGLQVRELLNEILKVRHSFAHGFTMPHYSWNTDAHGNEYLSCSTLVFIESFFKNISKKTDDGLKNYLADNFSIANSW